MTSERFSPFSLALFVFLSTLGLSQTALAARYYYSFENGNELITDTTEGKLYFQEGSGWLGKKTELSLSGTFFRFPSSISARSSRSDSNAPLLRVDKKERLSQVVVQIDQKLIVITQRGALSEIPIHDPNGILEEDRGRSAWKFSYDNVEVDGKKGLLLLTSRADDKADFYLVDENQQPSYLGERAFPNGEIRELSSKEILAKPQNTQTAVTRTTETAKSKKSAAKKPSTEISKALDRAEVSEDPEIRAQLWTLLGGDGNPALTHDLASSGVIDRLIGLYDQDPRWEKTGKFYEYLAKTFLTKTAAQDDTVTNLLKNHLIFKAKSPDQADILISLLSDIRTDASLNALNEIRNSPSFQARIRRSELDRLRWIYYQRKTAQIEAGVTATSPAADRFRVAQDLMRLAIQESKESSNQNAIYALQKQHTIEAVDAMIQLWDHHWLANEPKDFESGLLNMRVLVAEKNLSSKDPSRKKVGLETLQKLLSDRRLFSSSGRYADMSEEQRASSQEAQNRAIVRALSLLRAEDSDGIEVLKKVALEAESPPMRKWALDALGLKTELPPTESPVAKYFAFERKKFPAVRIIENEDGVARIRALTGLESRYDLQEIDWSHVSFLIDPSSPDALYWISKLDLEIPDGTKNIRINPDSPHHRAAIEQVIGERAANAFSPAQVPADPAPELPERGKVLSLADYKDTSKHSKRRPDSFGKCIVVHLHDFTPSRGKD